MNLFREFLTWTATWDQFPKNQNDPSTRVRDSFVLFGLNSAEKINSAGPSFLLVTWSEGDTLFPIFHSWVISQPREFDNPDPGVLSQPE